VLAQSAAVSVRADDEVEPATLGFHPGGRVSSAPGREGQRKTRRSAVDPDERPRAGHRGEYVDVLGRVETQSDAIRLAAYLFGTVLLGLQMPTRVETQDPTAP